MTKKPNIINSQKASSHPLSPGRFYRASVTFVDSAGRVDVYLPDLGVPYSSIVPVGTTELNKLAAGDTVSCTFTDEFFNDIVVFGSAGIKNDVFASKVLFEELLTNFEVLLARVTALETRYNSHTQHPPPA